MDLGPGVVEEGVVGAPVDVEFSVETQILQLLFQSGGRLGAEVVVGSAMWARTWARIWE